MEKELKVTGMTCEHCAKRVVGAIESVEGTSEVSVNLENGTAKFKMAKDVTNEVIEKIEDVGYKAV